MLFLLARLKVKSGGDSPQGKYLIINDTLSAGLCQGFSFSWQARLYRVKSLIDFNLIPF